ncbi:Amino acid/amide ABC transporter substrate-binding protein (HAAT family) [Bosea sp. 62]|uniref:ABC transporter substrate-binding protein n=1 Tax=unclassified Bosea (in: a-proteobacteria) TaxID=2653178 RepID=UPI001254A8A7|nr:MULTISPECIES: ABC transporter substrate-binding protein [unclassified Bosea (in: a-proteobacteria)]CAD5291814.1 Amino acid/amide ABC transporter substrate-binding protein (HAAT family) [Bosea sp. 7B]CAD5299465.1 Amino acid/amide ABC transporter substrate-binding protein (HAAT family) [Bosea sp. 21B]CAD5299610.1 Amino acid/amide ABC transporter substrate-binding protein (HAAT family) [Bosea sp. 46]VVT61694.1 Amino acid/amide ABC transporter substrate-binding protein, HAAT family [Bosea sp. EC
MKKHWIIAAALGMAVSLPALAQDKVKLVDVVELSGAGATAGTNWKNGIDLAVADINAKGGILGKQIEIVHYDTQTNPGNTRAAVQRAIDEGTYAVLGPVFSGPIGASMQIAQRAEIAQLVGGEAAGLTKQGNEYLFRTSLSQTAAMPKIAKYLKDTVKAGSVAVVWVNNDFGKGGRDAIIPELEKAGIKLAADIATEQGQADFAADAIKVKNSNADAIFVYLNEEESARFLRAAKQQSITKPMVGETTLLGAKVIELAGDAANGVKGHVGLSIDAPIPAFQEFGKKFQAKYNYASDHNGMKGYMAVYMVKWATEKQKKFDKKGVADTLRGATIKTSEEPGILIETTIEKNGDLDRESFLAEVKDGKQVITATLPKINP